MLYQFTDEKRYMGMIQPLTLGLVTSYRDQMDKEIDLVISVTALRVQHLSLVSEHHNLLQVVYTVRQNNISKEENVQRVQLSMEEEGWKIQPISIDYSPPGFLDWLKETIIEFYEVRGIRR